MQMNERMLSGWVSRLVGMYVSIVWEGHQLPTPVPTFAQACCSLRILPVSLQGLGPELRGQGVGAAGNEAPQAVPKTRTWKLPAASTQPGRFKDWGVCEREGILQSSEPSRCITSCFIDGKTRESQGLAESQMEDQWSS